MKKVGKPHLDGRIDALGISWGVRKGVNLSKLAAAISTAAELRPLHFRLQAVG